MDPPLFTLAVSPRVKSVAVVFAPLCLSRA
jgi:hypothetical protein